MALSDVKSILVRAATDPEFRSRLFDEPPTVFARYELTEEEKQSLLGIVRDPKREECIARVLDKIDITVSDIRI